MSFPTNRKRTGTSATGIVAPKKKAAPYSIVEFKNKKEMDAWRASFDAESEQKSLRASYERRQNAMNAFKHGMGSWTDKATHEAITARRETEKQAIRDVIAPKRNFFERVAHSVSKLASKLWDAAFPS